MAVVYAKNRKYTGVSASVQFVNGRGETENPWLLRWFEEHGYRVERPPEEDGTGEEPPDGEENENVESGAELLEGEGRENGEKSPAKEPPSKPKPEKGGGKGGQSEK